jgi:hypothetical protein
VVLHCEQCGRSVEPGMGWVTFVWADFDEIDNRLLTGACLAAARRLAQPLGSSVRFAVRRRREC